MFPRTRDGGLMKRDLYAEVSAHCCRARSRCGAMDWMAQAAGYWTPRYLTFKQALELGGHVRKGERGTKVYFVNRSEIHEDADDDFTNTASPHDAGIYRFQR